jgi:hypothetical protein
MKTNEIPDSNYLIYTFYDSENNIIEKNRFNNSWI